MRIKVQAGVERRRCIRHRDDRLHGDDASDLNRREIHDLDLSGGITRRRCCPAAIHLVHFLRRHRVDPTVPIGHRGVHKINLLPARMVVELQFSGILLALVGQNLRDIDVRRHPRGIREERRFARIENAPHIRIMQAVGPEYGLLTLRRLDALDLLAQVLVLFGGELHRADRQRSVHCQRPVRHRKRPLVIVTVRRLLAPRQFKDLSERLPEVNREMLVDTRRRIELQRKPALLERGVALQEPIDEPKRLRDRRHGELIPCLAADHHFRELRRKFRGHRNGRVTQILRQDLALNELRARHHKFQDPFERLHALLGRPLHQSAAVRRVVDATKRNRRLEEHRPIAGERGGRIDVQRILLRRRHRRGLQLLALGTAHEVTVVAQIRREQVLRVLIRRIHENIVGVGSRSRRMVFCSFLCTTRTPNSDFFFHGDNGVVEERLGHFGIELRADVDEHGECLKARKPQHRDKETGFVTANTVAIVEGDVHVMRRIPRRRVLHCQPHIPHFLRDELEDRLKRLQLLHLRAHRDVCLREMRGAKVPVPLGDLRPVFGGRDADVLDLRIEGWHVRFGERLRGIGHREGMDKRAVRELRHIGDDVAERIANCDLLQGT